MAMFGAGVPPFTCLFLDPIIVYIVTCIAVKLIASLIFFQLFIFLSWSTAHGFFFIVVVFFFNFMFG